MAASQLWYVPHRPDLLLLAPCDAEGALPGPGCMFVSIPDNLHPDGERADKKWKHPKSQGFATCFGDISKQQPRVVRCACGKSPCAMRGLEERKGVSADDFIPSDWATKFELPPDTDEHKAPESRRANAVELWLECTGRAEKELPPAEGKEDPAEEEVLKAAEMMLTDYFKGRVCFACNTPSTKMQKCSRCHQARYCTKECQRKHWTAHKTTCVVVAGAPAAAGAPAPATETAPAPAPEKEEKVVVEEGKTEEQAKPAQ